MHTYLKTASGVFAVGHYQIIGYEEASSEEKFIPMKHFARERDAAAFVSHLNGGELALTPAGFTEAFGSDA